MVSYTNQLYYDPNYSETLFHLHVVNLAYDGTNRASATQDIPLLEVPDENSVVETTHCFSLFYDSTPRDSSADLSRFESYLTTDTYIPITKPYVVDGETKYVSVIELDEQIPYIFKLSCGLKFDPRLSTLDPNTVKALTEYKVSYGSHNRSNQASSFKVIRISREIDGETTTGLQLSLKGYDDGTRSSITLVMPPNIRIGSSTQTAVQREYIETYVDITMDNDTLMSQKVVAEHWFSAISAQIQFPIQ